MSVQAVVFFFIPSTVPETYVHLKLNAEGNPAKCVMVVTNPAVFAPIETSKDLVNRERYLSAGISSRYSLSQ